jgi:repressor LexA
VVRGQSMIEDHICDKDYVVIKPQTTCENGDIVVAVHLHGNGQATLKRFYQEKEQNCVRLQRANSIMNPIFIPINSKIYKLHSRFRESYSLCERFRE